jgi:hypothetical protein
MRKTLKDINKLRYFCGIVDTAKTTKTPQSGKESIG